MKKRTIHTRLAIWLSVLMLIVCSVQPVYAAEPEKQIVRVAYFDMGDYYNEVSDGSADSYDTEVLNKVEKYSNLDFEYVNCGTWANALEMLNNHQVDLVGTAQWSAERETQYEYCLESYGYTVAELAALPENGYIYEDYDAIGKSVVGCTENYIRMNDMKALFQEHGISPTIKTYAGQNELEDALESGEIDLIAANSHTLKREWTVVEKFSYAPFFFVSQKDNLQLTNQMDDALIAIYLQEPSTEEELTRQYFPGIIGVPLTKAERDLIVENKTYDVYFDVSTKPTSWYDEKTGTMQGVLVEVCRQISESTGLKLNPVPLVSRDTKLNPTDIRTTTVYSGTDERQLAIPGETNPLLDEYFNLYYQVNNNINLINDTYTIAIVANRVHLRDYISMEYPNASIMECATPLACLEAVANGESDLAYLDCRIADNALTENGISNVKEFPIEAKRQGIALLFPETNQDLLVSIVNKGLEQVNQKAISNLFIQYALETQEIVTWKTIIRDHFGWVVFGSTIVFLLMMGLAVLFTYARVMKKQKDKIEKADADRTEFFARMSHDMRTPMNGILGMLRISKDTNDVSEMHDNIDKAEAAGEYMLSLINDTLDLQRLESKKLQLEKNVVYVADYYDSIFSIMKISAEQRHLDFKVQYIGINKSNYIELDAVRVKQILSNLISNAIKFTPEGGAVEITVESLGQDGDILHRKFQVKDTGVGMSKQFIENRLFKPYSQENNELSSQLTGSGLGMAITKNLIETMGGHLEVESELGEGTTFTAYLDVKRALPEDVEKTETERKEKEKFIMEDLSGKRILLCEDHPLNAEIAKKLLQKVGCTVEWAENGQLGVETFEQASDHSFDAILMDIRMPVMDGLAATRAIRELGKADATTIPIIAMTANAYESDIKNCLDAGMNAHVAKPVNPQQLYKTLYNAMSD